MVKIYISPYCASCRKAKAFLKDMKVPHEVINIFSPRLSKQDILDILEMSDTGTDALISPRSKIVKESGVDFDSMTVDQLVDYVLENPSVMRRPIIIDDRKMEVGYDPDQITAFLPLATKQLLETCEGCPLFDSCDFVACFKEATEKIEQELAKEKAEAAVQQDPKPAET